jgi:beta-glucosidase
MVRPGRRSTRADELVAALTLDEKASLTAGADFWSTVAVPRAGIPAVRVTDGPNGARGPSLPGESGHTSLCVPCGAALGATWDPALVERVGVALGEEARTKACRVLLAPTVNLHRSPLYGRHFECYSEDPLLSGRLAAAFVRGVQSQGVATTVKHLVGNDAEFERNTMSSVIDERTLREVYLLPFELAVRDGGALGVMTGYNRLNGVYCTEDAGLLGGILRDEWGFEGFVVTDWFGVAGTVTSAEAGVDLEMPGPARALGPAVAAAVRAGEIGESVLDDSVRRLLGVFERIGALDDPSDAAPQSVDRPEHRALAREAAAAAMVLLRNDGTLPLDAGRLRRVAIIGQNARRAALMGGGSAAVAPHRHLSPLQALRDALEPDVEVVHELGAVIDRTIPPLAIPLSLEYHAGTDFTGAPVHTAAGHRTEMLAFGLPDPAVPEPFSLRARGTFVPETTGRHRVTLIQVGRTRVLFDGAVVIDGIAHPPPHSGGDLSSFFGLGSKEVTATVDLEAGRPVDVVVEYTSEATNGVYAWKVGCGLVPAADLIDRAVEAAAGAGAAVVVVGTTSEWESEGHDRTSLALPGDQDELVARVAAANPRTVVVVNAGSPVDMPWADDVAAIVQVWFGGQEMGGALADVLLGVAEPGGRLPTTFPLALEHNPSYGNFPGEHDEVRYGEGLLVGYRWYDTRRLAARFAFGHGLSYTTWAIGAPRLSQPRFAPGDRLVVEVDVENTGTRAGSEVVQCYVAPVAPPVFRPAKELKAFAKVSLAAGERTTVSLALDDRAFARWDPGSGDGPALRARLAHPPAPLPERPAGWRVDPGTYHVLVGRSVREILHSVAIEVASE